MRTKKNELAQAARVAYFEAMDAPKPTIEYVRKNMDPEYVHVWAAVADAVSKNIAEKILAEARRTDNLANAENDAYLKSEAEGLFAAVQIADKETGQRALAEDLKHLLTSD